MRQEILLERVAEHGPNAPRLREVVYNLQDRGVLHSRLLVYVLDPHLMHNVQVYDVDPLAYSVLAELHVR